MMEKITSPFLTNSIYFYNKQTTSYFRDIHVIDL